VQSETLSPPPAIKSGGTTATVTFAGLVSPGEFQFKRGCPPNTPDEDNALTATLKGVATQTNVFLAVQY
jgi:uncharacterized protein (TIGR03437 family)